MAIIKFVGAILLGVIAVQCSRGQAQPLSTNQNQFGANPAFYIPEAASSVRVAAGGDDLSFELNEPYPAERFRIALDGRLQRNRWKPVDELKLYPGRKTSDHSAGWQRYLEGEYRVFRWTANWVDTAGSVITYSVTYKFPGQARPEGGTASVQGLHVTSEELKKMIGYKG